MLSSKDFFVDADVAMAESLPASAFTSEEFLQLELGTVFARSWLLIPQQDVGTGSPRSPADYLKSPEARIPYSLLGKPIFLQRSSKGGLHCFPNVCTHAWHPLVESANVGGAVICPQHGRQFSDEGRFVSQTGFDAVANFPRDSDHLRRFPVQEWGQFLFVCAGNPVAPFQDFVKDIQRSIPGIELAKLRRHSLDVEVRVVDGNWKQHAWNYMDNFHIRYVHKGPGGLADAVGLSTYKTELYRFSALQWVYA